MIDWSNVISIAARAFFPAMGLAIVTYVGLWIKRIYDMNVKNKIDSLQIQSERVNFEIQSADVVTLINASNKRHGATDPVVGQAAGNPAPKK